jgi:flagellar biosynthetic protein FliR
MDDFFNGLGAALRIFEVGQSPQSFLALVGLAFARLASFIQTAPFFGGAAVSGRVKVATALAFLVIVYPALAADLPPHGAPLPFGVVGFIALLAKEAMVGFTLGFMVSLIFEAIQMAGRFIDTQRGATMSEIFAPQLQLRVSELGQFKLQFAILLFFVAGIHRPFIGALLDSFTLVPALSFPHFTPGWSPQIAFFTNFAADMLAVGLQLAMPGIVALLLIDLFFGVLNRIAPQINVFFLSMPVKAFVGLLVILVALWGYLERYLHHFEVGYKAFAYLLKRLSQAF